MSKLSSFTKGMRAFQRGDHMVAVAALHAMIDRHDLPGRLARHYSAMSHRALGLDQISEGAYTQAAWHFRQAVGLIGNRADLAEYLLTAYAGAGRYDRCAAAADALTRACPDEIAPRVYRAQAQWRNGDRAPAYMTLTEALRRFGDHAELHLNLATFYCAEEKYDAARPHLLAAIECDCTCARAYHRLGLIESARGDYYQAARAFQRAWALDPENLLIAWQLSLAADAAGKAGRRVTITLPEPRQQESTSQIRQLAEYATSEPDFIEAFLSLPASDADEELFGVLLSVLQTALSAHDSYADLHYYTAVALQRLGEPGAAAGHLRQAIRINPKYVRALVEMGELCSRSDDRPAAAKYYRRAIDAGADWPDLHVRLGDRSPRPAGPEMPNSITVVPFA
jgi:tetratricopeptide (TPR) repeat protein